MRAGDPHAAAAAEALTDTLAQLAAPHAVILLAQLVRGSTLVAHLCCVTDPVHHVTSMRRSRAQLRPLREEAALHAALSRRFRVECVASPPGGAEGGGGDHAGLGVFRLRPCTPDSDG